MSDGLAHVQKLISGGKKIGVFSCEDPLNTSFHKDLLSLSSYVHLVLRPGAIVVPSSLDLGMSHKGIDAWGVFGHYGEFDGKKVCGAVNALYGDYSKEGADFKAYLDELKGKFPFDASKSLQENVKVLIKSQFELLIKAIAEKQKTVEHAVQGNIPIFAGIVYHISPTEYKTEILFKKE